jgi:hypothetical protein
VLTGNLESFTQITLPKNSAKIIDVPVMISAINLLTQAQNIKAIINNPIPGSMYISNMVIKTGAGNAPIGNINLN